MSQQVDLTDKDVWDDSSLIRNWDSLLREYKKYHSEEANAHGLAKTTQLESSDGNQDGNQDMVMDALGDEEDEDRTPENTGGGIEVPDTKLDPPQATNPDLSISRPPPVGINPCDGLDPSVKELVMSWYWAGYYQGYYNGKRDGAQR